MNERELVPSIHALEEMGHPQSPVPIQFDNKVATTLLNDECKSKLIKKYEYAFLVDKRRVYRNQFYIIWRRGIDYFFQSSKLPYKTSIYIPSPSYTRCIRAKYYSRAT